MLCRRAVPPSCRETIAPSSSPATARRAHHPEDGAGKHRAGELDREIRIEQDRAGIHDPAHFAYPTYAKAAIARRENLKRSSDELKTQLDDAQATLGEAFEELKKVEMLDERDQAREKAEANAREQTELDRIAAEVQKDLDDAVAFAQSSALPEPAARMVARSSPTQPANASWLNRR